jgi:hypothetical protein
MVDSSEHGLNLPIFIKSREFFDYLSDCKLLKEGSAPWS